MSKLVKNTIQGNSEKTYPWLRKITDACPHGIYSDFRKEIIFRCGWNKAGSTYTQKRNGVSPVTIPERVVIKQVCKEFNVPTFEEVVQTV